MDRTYLKSPFENVMNFLNVIPQGHEKALKHALYNAVALLLLFICSAAGLALFYILEPFVTPLIWAVLIGSVLHPFKYKLAKRFDRWLQFLEQSSTPLIITMLMVPVHIIDDVSNTVGQALRAYIKLMFGITLTFLTIFVTYTYTPQFCLSILYSFITVNQSILLFLIHQTTTPIILLILMSFITVITTLWTAENNSYFLVLSHFIWFFITLYFVKLFGILEVPIFYILMVLFSFGFIFEVINIANRLKNTKGAYVVAFKLAIKGEISEVEIEDSNADSDSKPREVVQSPKENKSSQETTTKSSLKSKKRENSDEISLEKHLASHEREVKAEVHFSQDKGDEDRQRPYKGASLPLSPQYNNSSGSSLSQHTDELDHKTSIVYDSNKYIIAVLWACLAMIIWKHIWLIHLFPFPIVVYIVKNLGVYFCLWNWIWSHLLIITNRANEWIVERESILFPAPLKGLYRISVTIRHLLLSAIRDSIDTFSSSLVIITLIVFTCCFSTFIVFQIYSEGIHLVTVTASVINTTVVNNPEVLQLLPDGWNNKMEIIFNDAYVHSREFISSLVRNMLKDVDNVKSVELEKRLLEFWDRVYQAWLIGALESSDAIGPKVSSSAVFSSWENFVDVVSKTPGLLNMNVMTSFAKENVGTLVSLLESVWSILKGNINLIFHFLFATLSVVLGGGTAVLNFTISFIVFLTALFYLLSTSGEMYKPVDLLSNFSPINGNRLGVAFEGAVNGVFKASFKMALFYGLWTWLIHNLFQVKLVYLPSFLAAILGAVPFLGTYWAAVPAVLDLWLTQHKGLQAVILFVFQCLPVSFVDIAIYTEIKGGAHPYLTGLAIAGGVFCMGIQGAILGPLLLCCLLVAINISSNLMKESPSDPSLSALGVRRLRR